jgi:hypothetical protein
MLGNATCTEERACPAHKFWTAHRAKVYDFLKMTNVADIASFEARRRWKTTLALQAGPTPGTISRGDSIPLPTIAVMPPPPPASPAPPAAAPGSPPAP